MANSSLHSWPFALLEPLQVGSLFSLKMRVFGKRIGPQLLFMWSCCCCCCCCCLCGLLLLGHRVATPIYSTCFGTLCLYVFYPQVANSRHAGMGCFTYIYIYIHKYMYSIFLDTYTYTTHIYIYINIISHLYSVIASVLLVLAQPHWLLIRQFLQVFFSSFQHQV